jgi:hypothetical protein
VVFTCWLNSDKSSDGVLCRWSPETGIVVIAREGTTLLVPSGICNTIDRTSVSMNGNILFQTYSNVDKGNSIYRVIGNVIQRVIGKNDSITFNGVPTVVLTAAIFDSINSVQQSAINDQGKALISISFGGSNHMNRIFE